MGPQPLRHIGPTMAKAPRCRHQHRFARRHGIGQRRLPCRVAIADIDGHMALGAGDCAQIRDQARGQFHDLALVNIGRRAVHRGQNRIGHDRWAGNGQIGAALGKGHSSVLKFDAPKPTPLLAKVNTPCAPQHASHLRNAVSGLPQGARHTRTDAKKQRCPCPDGRAGPGPAPKDGISIE